MSVPNMAPPTANPAKLAFLTVDSVKSDRSSMGSSVVRSRQVNNTRNTMPSAPKMSVRGAVHPQADACESAVSSGNRPSAASAAPSMSNGRVSDGGRSCITNSAPTSTISAITGVNQNTLRHPHTPTSTPARVRASTGATAMMPDSTPRASPRFSGGKRMAA